MRQRPFKVFNPPSKAQRLTKQWNSKDSKTAMPCISGAEAYTAVRNMVGFPVIWLRMGE